jgi:hypothetical protein
LNIFFSRYTVQNVFKVSDSTNWDVSALANSEVRIIILYCTQSEAALILEQAAKSGNIHYIDYLLGKIYNFQIS